MYSTHSKSQRWSRSVQTTFIPIFSQTRIKQPKNCLEVVNNFVSVSMIKICHNPMQLTNHKSQRWSSNVLTTYLPIFSQKRLKPTKYCLEVVNIFVSISIVKMCHNPMHLTNYKNQRWITSIQTTLTPIFSQET